MARQKNVAASNGNQGDQIGRSFDVWAALGSSLGYFEKIK